MFLARSDQHKKEISNISNSVTPQKKTQKSSLTKRGNFFQSILDMKKNEEDRQKERRYKKGIMNDRKKLYVSGADPGLVYKWYQVKKNKHFQTQKYIKMLCVWYGKRINQIFVIKIVGKSNWAIMICIIGMIYIKPVLKYRCRQTNTTWSCWIISIKTDCTQTLNSFYICRPMWLNPKKMRNKHNRHPHPVLG